MIKQRTVGPDMEEPSDISSQFLDSLRSRAMDDLHQAALEYGIVLKDLGALPILIITRCSNDLSI